MVGLNPKELLLLFLCDVEMVFGVNGATDVNVTGRFGFVLYLLMIMFISSVPRP